MNLSVQQLITRNSSDHLLNIIRESGVAPSKITLEITESMLMQSLDIASGILERLREQGIRIALDDFGIGYSSLNYLSTLPTDIIKIDRTLTSQLTQDEKQKTLARSIAKIAQFNSLSLTIEGIETEEELRVATEIGGDSIQGYYFAKPMPQEELLLFLN